MEENDNLEKITKKFEALFKELLNNLNGKKNMDKYISSINYIQDEIHKEIKEYEDDLMNTIAEDSITKEDDFYEKINNMPDRIKCLFKYGLILGLLEVCQNDNLFIATLYNSYKMSSECCDLTKMIRLLFR